MNKRIVFGNRVKDLVTGFEGIVTAEVRYMNGCEKWAIDGKVVNGHIESLWVDKQQCEFVDHGLVPATFMEKLSDAVMNGGPTVSAPIERRPTVPPSKLP